MLPGGSAAVPRALGSAQRHAWTEPCRCHVLERRAEEGHSCPPRGGPWARRVEGVRGLFASRCRASELPARVQVPAGARAFPVPASPVGPGRSALRSHGQHFPTVLL